MIVANSIHWNMHIVKNIRIDDLREGDDVNLFYKEK